MKKFSLLSLEYFKKFFWKFSEKPFDEFFKHPVKDVLEESLEKRLNKYLEEFVEEVLYKIKMKKWLKQSGNCWRNFPKRSETIFRRSYLKKSVKEGLVGFLVKFPKELFQNFLEIPLKECLWGVFWWVYQE